MLKEVNARIIVLCFFLVAGMSALSFQLVKIQIVDRKKYADKASSSYKRKAIIAHRRGMILDRNNEVIAHDILEKSIYVDKYQFLSVDVASRSLACKYLRDTLSRADGKIEVQCLEVLLTDSVLSAPNWMALDPDQRAGLIAKGARRLQEYMDVEEIKRRNVEFIVSEYYRPLGVSKEKLKGLIDLKDRRMHVLVAKGVDFEAARKLENLLNDHDVKGFDFREYVRREYKEPNLASHLVGFSDYTRKGMSGVEGQLESYLAGQDGSETRYIDARGYSIAGEQVVYPPRHGRDVRLTLDMRIQAIVEEELEAGMREHKCKKGAVVIMDPGTGEVLAMASRPHYNLNNRDKVVENGFNYAVQAANETGSTVKIIAIAAAMNEDKASYETEVDCGWGILYENGFTVKDHHPYGSMPLWKVLQKSSNTGAWQFAKMIGSKKFYRYAKLFGYGSPSGIRLVGESSGGIGNTGKAMDFSRCTYGYVLTASPLQIAAAYCVIGNGGEYVYPHIVKDIHAKNGLVIEHSSEQTRKKAYKVLKPSVARAMRDALETVTFEEGTARRARVEGYKVGGKTGTNHKVVDGKYCREKGKEKYITSFVGMCPIDAPNFVCVVVMDDPAPRQIWDDEKKEMIEFKRGGGTVAAPIFSKLVKRIAPVRGVETNFKEEN